MPRMTVIAVASLPLPGLPPSAIDALGTTLYPARLTKRQPYNALEFGFVSGSTGSGNYAVYRYWQLDRDWKPEGPRGATPAAIDTTEAGRVPVRVSLQPVDCDICIVLVSGTGVLTGGIAAQASVEEQIR